MNVEQTFQLIDSLLPYEVCSYHQILPIAVQGESLILGMVDPHNVSVLDYVRPILKPKNYFIKRRTLEDKIYKEVLAKYLLYQQQQRMQDTGEDDSVPTLIVHHQTAKTKESVLKNPGKNQDLMRRTLHGKPHPLSDRIPPLGIQVRYATAPVALLAQLPPHELIAELLGRSLAQNITQLSFERQQTHGRIIWSRQTRSKIFLEKIPIPLFQGLIHELKRFTNFPVKPVEKARKVEMLRLHDNKPVLLRLQFSPSEFGEQVMLQIFRDQLLQQYQKFQMDKLSKELLQITHSLEQKLKQAEARAQINPAAITAFPTLRDSLIQMIQDIANIQDNQVKTSSQTQSV